MLQLERQAPQAAPAVRACLVCTSPDLEIFLDLGETALANRFPAADAPGPEPVYKLRAGFCHGCGHVQLADPVPPDEMFRHYLYISSASATLTGHLESLARVVIERARPGQGDLVVDIGSNDGTLLAGFWKHRPDLRTLGVDPAGNLTGLARERGVETVEAFFDAASAARIRTSHGAARLITATNSFPHIPDLGGYLEGIRTLLAPDGYFVVEAHYLLDLIEQNAFDTIYHEHVSYWALGPARRLFEDHGFEVVDAERLPIHHGQLRLWIQPGRRLVRNSSVEMLLARERACALDRVETFHAFAGRARRLRDDLRRTLAELKSAGKRMAGYGAPAKASTLLAWAQIGPETLDYIADRSPLKQGRLTPGTRIPIVGPERILEDRPDFLVLLAWNFAEEIMQQLAAYRAAGGRFVIPVPEVRIL